MLKQELQTVNRAFTESIAEIQKIVSNEPLEAVLKRATRFAKKSRRSNKLIKEE